MGTLDHMIDRRLGRRADLRLGAVLTGVVAGVPAAVVVWARSVAHRLPDPVARHWTLGGPDGFSSLSATLAITVAIVVVVAGTMGVAATLARQPAMFRRMLGGTAAGLAVFTSSVLADGLRLQLDLASAAEAPAPVWGIVVGALAGALVGVGVAALARPDDVAARRAIAPPPADVPRLPTGAGTPSWRSRRVSVDRDGLHVRLLGVRVLHVPLEEVVAADVVDVHPFREFGGWGLRMDLHGRVGWVTRQGRAVRVRRGDASEVLVTVDDATDVAATLNTLADDHPGNA